MPADSKSSSTAVSETEIDYDVRVEASGPLGGYVAVPPSKNYSTRMILAASLAQGRSVISNPAANDDAVALVRCCRAFGAKIEEVGGGLAIEGVAGNPRNPGVINPGNAGAVLRLLLGVACLVEGEVRFETDHAESLGVRPNRELIDALGSLGAEIEATGAEGTLPLTICAGRDRLRAGQVRVDCSRSSQFLSSLLFLAPHLGGQVTIDVAESASEGKPRLVSAPLIPQTLDVLRKFGANVEASDDLYRYVVEPGVLKGGEFVVPGDWPSAAALLCSVAVAGGMATLRGIVSDAQGERRIVDALEQMGCDFTHPSPGELCIHSKGELTAIDFNGDLATDAVLVLEAAACAATGASRITGIENLRLKETDRIGVPLAELRKVGIGATSGEDWVEITGQPGGLRGGIEVDCQGDHRIAQMLAIVATHCTEGLVLKGAGCVSKSYPGFFEDLFRLGVKVTRI